MYLQRMKCIRLIRTTQGVVERFNRTLTEKLFGYQYAKELETPHKRNIYWRTSITQHLDKSFNLCLEKEGRQSILIVC